MFETCPKCNSKMRQEKHEISKGIFVMAWCCPKCKEEVYLDEKQYDRYYETVRRKAFKVGGSVAIRLPKKLADDIGIREGTTIIFKRKGEALIIQPA